MGIHGTPRIGNARLRRMPLRFQSVRVEWGGTFKPAIPVAGQLLRRTARTKPLRRNGGMNPPLTEKGQLRYVAGADAKAMYAMRLQLGDEAFRKAMAQQ